MALTLFSWGYYGWGNHTPHLVAAVDAAEAGRGFAPPVFVDVRVRRAVRAAGFTGPAFAALLGPARHHWMRDLGNRFVETRTGPTIQIARPEAADELLDRAAEGARDNRRVIFFCSCRWPMTDGAVACHRCAVARLVRAAAARRATGVEIVEWPGGAPARIELDVPVKDFRAVRGGRASVPLPASAKLADVAALPWGSVAALRAGGRELYRVVGPVARGTGGWVLPVLATGLAPGAGPDECARAAARLRAAFGLDPLSD